MEIGRTQNLGFGVVFVRLDKTIMGRENFKKSEKLLSTTIGKGNYNIEGINDPKKAFQIFRANETEEKSLLTKVKELGAQTIHHQNNEDATKTAKEHYEWLNKKRS